MILDGEADGNRAGSDPEPLIILSTLAESAEIAEIFSLRNQGFNVPQIALQRHTLKERTPHSQRENATLRSSVEESAEIAEILRSKKSNKNRKNTHFSM